MPTAWIDDRIRKPWASPLFDQDLDAKAQTYTPFSGLMRLEEIYMNFWIDINHREDRG